MGNHTMHPLHGKIQSYVYCVSLLNFAYVDVDADATVHVAIWHQCKY